MNPIRMIEMALLLEAFNNDRMNESPIVKWMTNIWQQGFVVDVFFSYYCVCSSKFHIIDQILSGRINTHSD